MAAPKLVALPGLKVAPKSAPRSRMDTMIITPDSVATWRVPPFQRPLKVNLKVREMAERLTENGGIVEGVIMLGVLDGQWYIVDGQHRMEAFRMSGLKEGLVDVRIVEFEEMADMAEAFANCNDYLVRMTPDDKLRALESSLPALQLIRQRCKFVAYGSVRRAGSSALLSMSATLRTWVASAQEVPQAPSLGITDIARGISVDDAEAAADYLNRCYGAWGADPEYYRLWGNLNLSLMAWLWRRMVTGRYSPRTTKLTKEQFAACAMAVSAKADYLAWLVGRKDAERSPAYLRLKHIFAARMIHDGIEKPQVPAPLWAANSGSKK